MTAPDMTAVERTLLQRLEAICNEIFERWDKDQRSGKLLTALAGRLPGYRADVDEVRAALAALPQPAEAERRIGQPVVKVPMDAVFLCEEHDCCYVLQSALPREPGEAWRGIESARNKLKDIVFFAARTRPSEDGSVAAYTEQLKRMILRSANEALEALPAPPLSEQKRGEPQ